MSERNFPKMSVVIVTPDHYETIRTTIGHLRAQTVRDQLELVIVAPSADKLDPDPSVLADFRWVRVVDVGAVRTIASANAAGIRQASAPVVALIEEHVFPDPAWAEALIAAHRRPCAAVGPVIRNANPGSFVSWADLLLAYAPWLDPTPAGAVAHLPGHNSSYKRAVLVEYGPELETMLEAESVLHWSLRSRGYELYLEPAAKIAHLNFSRLSTWIPCQFYSARVFAASRAMGWSALRRLLYIGGAPLIPLVRVWRIVRDIRRRGRPHRHLLQALPALGIGLIVRAGGEMIGYALGAGNAKQRLAPFEFHRRRHLRKQDRSLAVRA